MTYAPERLYEEIAYVAYHFHWSLDEIVDFEHPMRRRFIEEIARINRRLSEPPAPFQGKIFGLPEKKAPAAGTERVNYGLAQL
jgi:hypothetical protein